MNLNEMKQELGQVLNKQTQMLDKASAEKREFTAEEQVTYDTYDADRKRIKASMDRFVDLENAKRENNNPDAPSIRAGVEDGKKKGPRATQEYLDSVLAYCRKGQNGITADILNVLQVGDPTGGGYLVSTELEKEILRYASQTTVMRQIARVVISSNDRNIPVAATKPVFTMLGENEDYTETDMKFGVKTLKANKGGGIILISEELLQDSEYDLVGEISTEGGEAMGVMQEGEFVAGDGTPGHARGILLDAGDGGTTAANNAVTADEMLDLTYSVKPVYRAAPKAGYLTTDLFIARLRKLKDTTGQYLWQPSLQGGQPDRFNGYPVYTSDFMPAFAASAKPVLFGDYGRYRIQDRAGVSILRLNELYAKKGQIGFRLSSRFDGALLLPEAVKALTVHA